MNDSLAQFAKIDKERERLKDRLVEAVEEEENLTAKASVARSRWKRIKVQLKALKEREKDLVVRGGNTIAEMDELAAEEGRVNEEVEAMTPDAFDVGEFSRLADEMDWGEAPDFDLSGPPIVSAGDSGGEASHS